MPLPFANPVTSTHFTSAGVKIFPCVLESEKVQLHYRAVVRTGT